MGCAQKANISNVLYVLLKIWVSKRNFIYRSVKIYLFSK